ncbi:YicC/YloC family endoribonuclease [Alkalicoccus urumqiensis]|uniref:YicC family protein n=1 Tax=Alkalicoccus urumqiensis TaxID=1548213 RepID=A0A2P6MG96_ALKUR|nr:YicC/YloC family endoribonuclease [Alkalicoccus urumqiensis]PRO65283.1 YicC family protein [Alkalicoccus urumqiensis]
MLKSMTGFGRLEEKISGGRVRAEIKAVNHRFCEIHAVLPKEWQHYEPQAVKELESRIERGRIDLLVEFIPDKDKEADIHINEALLAQLKETFDRIAEQTGSTDSFPAAAMLEHKEVTFFSGSVADEAAAEEVIPPILHRLASELNRMKRTEGKALEENIEQLLEKTVNSLYRMENAAPAVRTDFQEKLASRISRWLSPGEISEDRILTEAAVFAEKADVTEEITRLWSHIHQFRETLNRKGSAGRRLEFILQEMNREINTIGSKASLPEISAEVIDVKESFEKIKEQIQNIE